MNWSQIRRLFLSAVGETQVAVQDSWLHLSAGYRNVCAREEGLQGLEESVNVLTTTASVDYLTRPTSAFHILAVMNFTSGFPLWPEPSGLRGRERYFNSTTGMPDEGTPRFWCVSDSRIYLRPTPDDEYELNVRYKIQPSDLSDSDLSAEPLTPRHLDEAIVFASALHYLRIHPASDVAVSEGGPAQSDKMKQALNESLTEPFNPKKRELFAQTGRAYMPFGFWRR